MRRVIFFSLLCCILLAFLLQIGSCTTATINVVKNPSFESGLEDWEWGKVGDGYYGVRDDDSGTPDGEWVAYLGKSPHAHDYRAYLCGELLYQIPPNTTWTERHIDISDYRGKFCYLKFEAIDPGYAYVGWTRQKIFIPLDAHYLSFYHKEISDAGQLRLDYIRIFTTRDYEEIQDPSFEYEIGNNPDVCWSEYEEVNASSYSTIVATSTEYAKHGSKSLKLSANISDGNYVLAGVRQKIELTDVDYLKF